MGLESFTRQYQVLLFGGLVALAAFYQASGIANLVGGHLVPESSPRAASKVTTQGATHATKSGREILARNAFDSVTGPLDGSAAGPASSSSAAPPVKKPGGDPYQDPPCSGVRARLVTATEDRAWSFASLSLNNEDKLRRIGDKLGQFTVEHIGYYDTHDQWEFAPRVWLMEGGSRCIVEMGEPEAGEVKKPSDPSMPKPKSPTQSKRAELEAKLNSKIKKIGENQYEVDKSGVELIISNYAKLAGSVRGKATKEGMRVNGIREGSPLGQLGLKNGDMLQSINGFDMSDPDKAVDAYAKLRRAGKLEIAASRDGSSFTVNVQIK